MFRITAPLAIALLSSGASALAAGKPITPSIEGKSIVLVGRPDPGFLFSTAGGSLAAAAAALGPGHNMKPGSDQRDAGKQLMAEDGIDDPSIALGSELLTALVGTYKLQAQDANPRIVNDDKALEDLRKESPTDLILEVYTENWRLFYFLFDFQHYDIWYYAKARLIDTHTGSVIRKSSCTHKPVKTAATPTLDEMLADHGAKLRATVDAARVLCLQTVREDFGA